MKEFASVIPTMRYRDCQRAIEWLCDHIGFEKKMIHEDENKIVLHAQLVLGKSIIMVSTKQDSEWDQLITIPMDNGNINTVTPYIIIEDVPAKYKTLKSKSVEIVYPLTQKPHGTGFSCRDPEGYIWNFGDYNPWVEK